MVIRRDDDQAFLVARKEKGLKRTLETGPFYSVFGDDVFLVPNKNSLCNEAILKALYHESITLHFTKGIPPKLLSNEVLSNSVSLPALCLETFPAFKNAVEILTDNKLHWFICCSSAKKGSILPETIKVLILTDVD